MTTTATTTEQQATLHIIMSSSSVWVQLFYEDERKGSPEQIYRSDLREGRDWNVASLKVLVKDKLKELLDHAGLTELFVYPPDIEQPFSEQTSIRGDKIVKELIDEFGNKNPPLSIDYDHPLILVAPAPPQPPPQPAPFLVNCRTWSNENNHRNPVVLAWEQGSDGSPKDFPGEIALPFSGSAASSLSTSSRGHIQKMFQAQLLERDNQKCVVSGKPFKQGSGTVEAAHIIPVESPVDLRHRAGLRGLYDTRNGMLLESTLHEAFDSYIWCMNEEGKFCLSDAESHAVMIRKYGLSKWEGKTLNLGIGIDPDAPTKATLKARYDLFLAKVEEEKQKENKKSKASLTKKN
ncbi:HNH endonuclease [Nitzschia inconspicua]|uniref:HNH endonuclease n=1 Tax=Nitzschia inconspicua TaxID=303405 RepID=A0A9K3KYG0_9STRA|nr:HNH endonuclease [Nitzschia inconspicua]